MSIALLDEVIKRVQGIMDKAEGRDRKELTMLLKDLEEAKWTIFVKTAEAKPYLKRCRESADALKDAVEGEGAWGEGAKNAFSSFERAVSKLRNTIMVRTQRAT
jgi:hypothetical protein